MVDLDLDWRASGWRVERLRHQSVNSTPGSRNHIKHKLPCQIWLEKSFSETTCHNISKVVAVPSFSPIQHVIVSPPPLLYLAGNHVLLHGGHHQPGGHRPCGNPGKHNTLSKKVEKILLTVIAQDRLISPVGMVNQFALQAETTGFGALGWVAIGELNLEDIAIPEIWCSCKLG